MRRLVRNLRCGHTIICASSPDDLECGNSETSSKARAAQVPPAGSELLIATGSLRHAEQIAMRASETAVRGATSRTTVCPGQRRMRRRDVGRIRTSYGAGTMAWPPESRPAGGGFGIRRDGGRRAGPSSCVPRLGARRGAPTGPSPPSQECCTVGWRPRWLTRPLATGS